MVIMNSIDENLTQLLLYQNVPSSFITWQQFRKIAQLWMYYKPYITDGKNCGSLTTPFGNRKTKHHDYCTKLFLYQKRKYTKINKNSISFQKGFNQLT